MSNCPPNNIVQMAQFFFCRRWNGHQTYLDPIGKKRDPNPLQYSRAVDSLQDFSQAVQSERRLKFTGTKTNTARYSERLYGIFFTYFRDVGHLLNNYPDLAQKVIDPMFGLIIEARRENFLDEEEYVEIEALLCICEEIIAGNRDEANYLLTKINTRDKIEFGKSDPIELIVDDVIGWQLKFYEMLEVDITQDYQILNSNYGSNNKLGPLGNKEKIVDLLLQK